MVNLLLGAPNTGKTTQVLSQIVKTLRDKRGNAILVAPSTNAAEVFVKRLQSLIPAAFSSKAHSVVMTFPALYQKILNALGHQPIYLDSLRRDRLLRKAIAELTAENALTYFTQTATKPGLVKSLAAFINELWQSASDAESFVRLTAGRSTKDRDMALIFRRYQTLLDEADLIDAEGAGNLALAGLEKLNAKQSKRLKELAVYIAADGFDFYAPDKMKLLSQLSEIGIETTATLTYEPERDVHLWQRRTYERFTEARAEMTHFQNDVAGKLPKLAASLLNDGWHSTELSAAQKAEFTEAMKIISAPDRISEVRAIARDVKKLVIEDGLELDEITIICRSPQHYADHFTRIFTECGIPLTIDLPLALNQNAGIIGIIQLLRLANSGFQRRAFIDFLRSPYFSLSAFQLNEQDIDFLERISYKERITQGRNLWLEIFSDTKPSEDKKSDVSASAESSPEKAGKIAHRLGLLFEALTLPDSASRNTFVRKIRSLIELFKIEACLQQGETAAIDSQALQVFYGVLETLTTYETTPQASLFSPQRDSDLTWTEFSIEFERAILAMSFEVRRDSTAAIILQEAHNLRPRNYQAIFIAGLIEGEFPKRSSERFPYTLTEREELRRIGIDFAETTDDAGADLTQFHKAISRTVDKLFLSYARTELTGGELLKSYLIDEVKAITGIAETRIAQIGESEQISREVVSNEELALLTTRAARHTTDRVAKNIRETTFTQISSMLNDNLRSWRNTNRALTIEQRRLSGKENGVFGGFILNQKLYHTVQQNFADNYSWTASKIDEYGNCPFKFFASSVLNLSRLEEPSEGFTHDKLGSAYHEILEQTYKRLGEKAITLNKEAITEVAIIVEEISEQIFQEYLDSRKLRKSRLWEYETKEIKQDIVNLLTIEAEANQDNTVTPIAFEKRFGMGGEPPLVIEGESGKIKIRGIIDRIDESDSGFVVIDYKTSRTVILAREAEEGRNLQLPIYLMAANRFVKTEKPVESGYYLHVRNYKKGSEFPNKKISMEELETRTLQYINDYVAGVRQAEFPIEPKQANCHQRCPYDGLCRIQSLQTAERDE